jgi:hypothetical protein
MPNHCYNSLTIRSDNYGLLTQLRDAALADEPKLLEVLRPFTEETNYEWDYDWCVQNWSTKWDIFDVNSCYLTDGELTLTFDTAWCPPNAALDYGAERLGFEFELEYYEPGVMFAGIATQDYDDCYSYTFDRHPFEEMPKEIAEAHGIDRDYDYFILDCEDEDLSVEQKEYRKMLRESNEYAA